MTCWWNSMTFHNHINIVIRTIIIITAASVETNSFNFIYSSFLKYCTAAAHAVLRTDSSLNFSLSSPTALVVSADLPFR